MVEMSKNPDILHQSIPALDTFFPDSKNPVPNGYSFLIFSTAGAGKTIFAYSMLYNYIKNFKGAKYGLYLTFEQSAESQMAQLHGLEVFEKDIPGVFVLDELAMRKDVERRKKNIIETSETAIRELQDINKKFEAAKGKIPGADVIINYYQELIRGAVSAYIYAKNTKPVEYNIKGIEAFLHERKISADAIKEILGGRKKELPQSRHTELDAKISELSIKLDELGKELSELEKIPKTPLEFIDHAIEETQKKVGSGEMGISKNAKLGVVIIDSLQILEAELEIVQDPNKLRKVIGRFIRGLMEKYTTNIVAILEAKHKDDIEHPGTLPESYAFDTLMQLKVEPRPGQKTMVDREIRIVKHRVGNHARGWAPYDIVSGKGIDFPAATAK